MLRHFPPLRLLNHQSPSPLISNNTIPLIDSLTLKDWPKIVNNLQSEYRCNFLPIKGKPLSVVKPVINCQRRLTTCCVVTITSTSTNIPHHNKPRSLWIPFIINTGAPHAVYLSRETLNLFGVVVPPPPSSTRHNNTFVQPISIGKWRGEALLSEENHLKSVNVLGMDLFHRHHDLTELFTVILERNNRDMKQVWVQQIENGKVVDDPITVSPQTDSIDGLKKALAAENITSCSAKRILVFKDVTSQESLHPEIALEENSAEGPYFFVEK